MKKNEVMSNEEWIKYSYAVQTGADDIMDMTPDYAPAFQKKIFTTKNGKEFGSMELSRDSEGRVIKRTTTFGGTKNTREFTYDAKGRLGSVKVNGWLSEAYDYGSRGERVKEVIGTRYMYNASSQLAKMATPKGNTNFAYDAKKRRIEKLSKKGKTTYSYDKNGFLQGVHLPDGRRITYQYDPLGRRCAKLINNVVTEKYCWADMLRLQAVCTGTDTNHVVFVYDPDAAESEQPVAFICNDKEYYPAYDQAGSLLAIADDIGKVIHVEETDSFGRRLSNTPSPLLATLNFAGGLRDTDTGLIHFLFRDYDPATGFFIQPDPLGLRGGDVDVYGYCLDDPVNLVDPLGLKGSPRDVKGGMKDLGTIAAGKVIKLLPDDAGEAIGSGAQWYGGGAILTKLTGIPGLAPLAALVGTAYGFSKTESGKKWEKYMDEAGNDIFDEYDW